MDKKLRALSVVVGIGALVGGVGYGTAAASGGAFVKADDATSVLATVNLSAHKTGTSDSDVKGYFKGDPTSPVDALLKLRGPITCLVVEGNRAGLLYPIEDNSMPFLIKGQYVLISLEDGGKNGTDRMGFAGPAPQAAFPSCAPQPTPFEVTSGDIIVHDKND